MTCPNRDGTLGNRGCIFCSSGGSGEFSADSSLDISAQIEWAKEKIKSKTKCRKFIAYFRPFTNTYANAGYLEKIFTQAIQNEEIVALSVATRPDCLPCDVLQVLEKLNKIKPVWVELGLQTIHKSTADYIRRCYELEVYDRAVENLHRININVITHIIIGLPFETKQMIVESVKYAAKKTDGIKLQLLHVLKNTDLLNDYKRGIFKTLSLDEYTDILCDCIENIPKNVVIHRITGDGDKKLLVAPLWSADKKRVLNTINNELNRRNIIHGSKA